MNQWVKNQIFKNMKEKYLNLDGYMLEKVLEKIKEIIRTENFDDAKILIYTDDKLLDDTTLKNVVILMICVIIGQSIVRQINMVITCDEKIMFKSIGLRKRIE